MNIRFLKFPDITAYRELRLRALKESPSAFGSDYDYEAALPQGEFAARLQPNGNPANGVFGAFADDGRLAGLLGFTRENRRKRAHVAALWSMYVLPEFRRQGMGAALLDQAIAHARCLHGIRQITLSVTANNEAARRLYVSRGFERYGLERNALLIDGEFFDEDHMVLFFA